MLVIYNLLILARNLRYAINFLRFINFNSLNYNFKRYFIRIVLTNFNSLNNKDSYFSNSIIIKANLKIKLRLLWLIKISYSKTSIDLYYQISQQMRSLCNDLSFVSFRITIIRFSSSVLNIRSNNKFAHIIIKQTRTRILIKKIILIMRNITIRKIKNTMLKIVSRRSKITTSKSSFFKFSSHDQETRNANNAT